MQVYLWTAVIMIIYSVLVSLFRVKNRGMRYARLMHTMLIFPQDTPSDSSCSHTRLGKIVYRIYKLYLRDKESENPMNRI